MYNKLISILESHAIATDSDTPIPDNVKAAIDILASDGKVSAQLAALEDFNSKSQDSLGAILNRILSELDNPEEDNMKIIINTFCSKFPALPPAAMSDEVLI